MRTDLSFGIIRPRTLSWGSGSGTYAGDTPWGAGLPSAPSTPAQPVNTDPAHPPFVLVGDHGSRIVLPYAPVPNSHGRGMTWEQVPMDGAGVAPVLVQGPRKLRTQNFDLTLARLDHQQDVEDWLQALSDASEGIERWTVSYGPQEVGLWRISGFSVDVTGRQYLTNRVTRAVAHIELTEAGGPAPVGPQAWKPAPPPPPSPQAPPTSNSGAPVPAPSPSSTAPPATSAFYTTVYNIAHTIPAGRPGITRYTVRSGDTLTAISLRYYGSTSFYSLIALVNGIRNPDLVTVGQVLNMPQRL